MHIPFPINSSTMSQTFKTSLGLSNPHINTILTSSSLRRRLVQSKTKQLEKNSERLVLEVVGDIRLEGFYTPSKLETSKGLVVLIHGWEGCHRSNYMLSALQQLHEDGFSVFRLNMRDHGDTHHLNQAPFLAINLTEIEQAILQVLKRFPHDHNYLIGYSLGGNMSVRIGTTSVAQLLNKIIAVCPPIDPAHAVKAMQKQLIYNRYFVHKWQRSLRKKINLFPEYNDCKSMLKIRDLAELHQAFVPRFSIHPDDQSYYRAYTLNKDNLSELYCPVQLVMSEDDPVIPVADISKLPKNPQLSVITTKQGGHCGFIQDWSLSSWLDQQWLTWLNP